MTLRLWLALSLTLVCRSRHVGTAVSTNSGLTTITECICPGYMVTYECIVPGGVFTVYGGTAFDCAGNEITLSNNDFGAAIPPAGACNNGQIVGRGIAQQNGCYRSELNLTFSETLTGTTVTCGVDDGSRLIPLDSTVLRPTNRSLAPPSNFNVTITPTNLTVTWEHVSHNCPGLYYNITSSMTCGSCPSGTAMSRISCSNFELPTNCTIMIQAVTCWETSAMISGNATSLLFFLRVPKAPVLKVIPYYNDDRRLIGVNTTFSKDRFMISDSIDGSPMTYNVTYSDLTGRIRCGSSTIATSSASCNNNTCSHYSSGICSSFDSLITVFGTNMLGRGASSTEQIGHQNQFVTTTIVFTQDSKKVSCSSITKLDPNTEISCEISIASSRSCRSPIIGVERNTSTSSSEVTVDLDRIIKEMDNGNEFCYTITASIGPEQVVVQDTYTVMVNIPSDSNTVIVILSVIAVFVIIAAVLIVIIFIIAVIVVTMQTKDRSPDCESFEVQSARDEEVTVEECGKKRVGDEYQRGEGYYLGKDNDPVPEEAKVMARTKDGKVYKAGKGTKKKLIKDNKIVESSQRLGKYKEVELLIQDDDKILKEGDEFVHYKKGAKSEKLKQWYYTYDVDKNTTLEEFCQRIGKELSACVTCIYLEKCQEGAETKKQLPPDGSKVIVVKNDGKLFDDSKKLHVWKTSEYIDLANVPGKSVLRPPTNDWKYIFYQSRDITPQSDLLKGTKLLYRSRKHALTQKQQDDKQTYDLSAVDKKKTIKDWLQQERPDHAMCEVRDGYIYVQTEDCTPRPQDKVIAQDKEGKWCVDPGPDLLTDVDYEMVWDRVFVQVTNPMESLKQCEMIMYCKLT